ncbi:MULTISPECIES: GNAT family N-acetyltransferase [unclassified Streptomyces]|uniref:GNAT family N-acetyltransferase n=1 Tax=unclassified Streptomyces TaxID=2593676 RepID=UPI00278BFF7A|nr:MULTISPECIES: GNAT family N-acetyltransferase [unclassified Streptomyces]
MTLTCTRLTPSEFPSYVDELGNLLVDVVRGGSSLGFLHGLTPHEATAWWRDYVGPSVERGGMAVWVAVDKEETGRCLGTISLAFVDKPNGRHRAEVVKLMVHGNARGTGLGRTLLATAERAAADEGITLLVLDTETGSPAEDFYRKAGWEQTGVIPDYAADPAGVLRPTTLFCKRLEPAKPAGDRQE